jgi:hypothetical protein
MTAKKVSSDCQNQIQPSWIFCDKGRPKVHAANTLAYCGTASITAKKVLMKILTDFQDLKDFHRGYMGRKLLILEGRLTSRCHVVKLLFFFIENLDK